MYIEHENYLHQTTYFLHVFCEFFGSEFTICFWTLEHLSWLAGPIHPDGLGLQSRRIPHGLIASIAFEQKFQAFPGIIQGGIVASAFECHGNWTAAIHLMDMSCLPRPPLTLTASIMVGLGLQRKKEFGNSM